VLGFFFEKPGGEVVFVVEGIAIEAVVDELSLGGLPVHESLCEGYGLSGEEAVF
jgi:hypothetical protein